jgi:hypothetical protein
MDRIKQALFNGFGPLLLAVTASVAGNAQATFDLKPLAPSQAGSIWVDVVEVSYRLRLAPTEGVKTNGEETIQRSSFGISRSVRMLASEPQTGLVLEVVYVPVPANASLPPVSVVPEPLTAPLEGQRFRVHCADMSVTIVPNESRAALRPGDENIVQRECREFLRNGIRENLFSNIKVGETRKFPAGSEIEVLSEDLTELGLIDTVISLERVDSQQQNSQASFAVRTNIRSDGKLGRLFGACSGTLSVDSHGLSTQFELICPVKVWSPTSPAGPEVQTDGEMRLLFVRKNFGP